MSLSVFYTLHQNLQILNSVTFIGRLMHSVVQTSKVKIYVVSILKDN